MPKHNPFANLTSKEEDQRARNALLRMKVKKKIMKRKQLYKMWNTDDTDHWEDDAFKKPRKARLRNA